MSYSAYRPELKIQILEKIRVIAPKIATTTNAAAHKPTSEYERSTSASVAIRKSCGAERANSCAMTSARTPREKLFL